LARHVKSNEPSKRKSNEPPKEHKLTPLQQLYHKELQRLHRAVKKAEKKGYIFDEANLPKMPKRVTKQSLLRIQKTKPKKLYEKAQHLDKVTGELEPAKKALKRAKQQAIEKAKETKRLKKEAERKFWGGEYEEPPRKKQPYEIPDGGAIIFNNVLDDFILKLSSPTPEYTPYGKKRRMENYETSERERTTLYTLTMKVMHEIGRNALAWRMEDASDRLYGLLEYILYGSDSAMIQSASHELAQVIAGGYLPISDLMDLSDESELEEDWEDTD
jgi:predicted ATP-dependent protease